MLNMVRSRKKQSIGFTAKVRRSKNADRVSRNLTRLKKKLLRIFSVERYLIDKTSNFNTN